MNNAVYTDYSPMKWNQEYSVEVPELDSQHKELMTFFNATLDKCSGKESEEREYFDKTIEAFIDILAKHFRTEQQFFAGRNYVHYDKHILEHIKILEKIHFIKSEIENNRWKMKLFILATTLKDMLMHHLNSYDISAKDYFGGGNIIQASEENYFAFQV